AALCSRDYICHPSRPTSDAGGSLCRAQHLSQSRVRGSRRAYELRIELYRHASPSRHLHWSHPQGRKTCRPAGDATDHVRVSHQPANRSGARPRRAAHRASPRRRGDRMKRRDFITLLGGAAVASPLPARAQQERMRRIGVLMGATADDTESQARLGAFLQGLQSLGWTEGRNVRCDISCRVGHTVDYRKYALELVALAPDAILAGTGGTVPALQQATRTIPIVFAQTIDPVGGGFIKSLARPGGNTTGFTQFEYTLAGKWPELLK